MDNSRYADQSAVRSGVVARSAAPRKDHPQRSFVRDDHVRSRSRSSPRAEKGRQLTYLTLSKWRTSEVLESRANYADFHRLAFSAASQKALRCRMSMGRWTGRPGRPVARRGA